MAKTPDHIDVKVNTQMSPGTKAQISMAIGMEVTLAKLAEAFEAGKGVKLNEHEVQALLGVIYSQKTKYDELVKQISGTRLEGAMQTPADRALEPKENKPFTLAPHETLNSAVYQAIGAGSTCWESMEGTGVFQDDRARQVAEALIAHVHLIYGGVE